MLSRVLRAAAAAAPARAVVAAALALALAAVPRPLAAQDLLAQARALYDRGRLDSALTIIRRSAEQEPNRAEAHYWLGMIAAGKAQNSGGLGRVTNASRSKAGFSRAVQLSPDNPDYLEGLVMFLGNAPGLFGGNRDSAIVLAERVRRLDEVRGTFLLANLLRRGTERQRPRADSLVDAISRARAGDRTVQIGAAQYFAGTQRPDRALPLFERVAARDSTDLVARYGVARNLVVLLRDPRRAQGILRWVIANNPRTGDERIEPAAPWWRLGQTWVQLGQPDSARSAYQHSLEINARFEQARRSLDSLARR
jgi:tetratricopeptide (TPR) repeat protein